MPASSRWPRTGSSTVSRRSTSRFLRLAMFEMIHRKDIPPVVSINEAIDLSKQFSNADAKRFINGILDRLKGQLGRDARKAE
jgi:N utilization substance protein B